LPYQPLRELSSSLSAADLHVVVMGEKFVGIVHPCKVYNIMSVGAPVLYIGPEPSHITDIASQHFFLTRHGDVEGVTAAICEAMQLKDFSGLKDEVLVGPVKPVAERNAL
jgi:hypothetical protein